jgi:CDP-diacylglycerol--glycerol-3-phosphate 3-phosphatidyltransferase
MDLPATSPERTHMNTSYYVINGITMYRLVSAPFLLLLAWLGAFDWFRWLIGLSFLTDAIDGPLSRKFKTSSIFGARLDSVADDATVFTAILGLWIIHPEFMREHWAIIGFVFLLFGIQTVAALVAYRRVTSFHTYLAKIAAVIQALFFMMMFFQIGPVLFGFYCAIIVTGIELIEEIILVILLPTWQSDVKGLYWVLKKKQETSK